MRTQSSFYIIVSAIFLIIVSPYLMSDGMFMDGLWYASISKNISSGIGSFWNLKFTESVYPSFHEHPPLAFGLQSVFFTFFGDSIYVERFYSLLTFVINGILLVFIWRLIAEDEERKLGWVPLLFWITMPLVTWAASNNILENTMMVFCSASVYFILKSLEKRRFINMFLSGVFLFFAFLSKGFTSLFPFSLPLWLFLFGMGITFSRFVIDSFVMLLAFCFSLVLLQVCCPEGIESLTLYFNKQVVGSLKSIETVSTRWYIVGKLLLEITIMISISLIVYIVTKKEYRKKTSLKWTFIFLALGLSGVIPIMISMKQRGFYILATFPFFSIAIAYFISPYVSILLEKVKVNIKIFSLILLSFSIVLVVYMGTKIGRDNDKIGDVLSVLEFVENENVLKISKSLWNDYSLHGYFYRYGNVSLDVNNKFDSNYFLNNKGEINTDLSSYHKVDINLEKYDLWKKK